MAILKSEAIAADNVKIRWQEPYISFALNRVLSSLPRGVYRGFVVGEKGTPGAGVAIKILAGRDSFLLHEDVADGLKTSVRYDDDFDFDFALSISISVIFTIRGKFATLS